MYGNKSHLNHVSFVLSLLVSFFNIFTFRLSHENDTRSMNEFSHESDTRSVNMLNMCTHKNNNQKKNKTTKKKQQKTRKSSCVTARGIMPVL